MQIPLPAAIQRDDAPDLSQFDPDAQEVSCTAGQFRIARYHLNRGMSQGVELLVVDSGLVRAAICPTRGMSLWRANIEGQPCGWNSPVQGPVNPSHVSMEDPLGWLDGFDELLVRCGMQSFGAPDFAEDGGLLYPLHGRVGNLPATEVSMQLDGEHSLLKVTGKVAETRFLQFNLELKASFIFHLGQPTIEVIDSVTNRSANPTGVQMLYHINIGQPTLDEGSKLHLAGDRLVARNERAAADIETWQTYLPPTTGYEEQVYFSASQPDEKGWADALLADAAREKGFRVQYDTSTLPFFTQWKNTVALEDGFVTGLEPGTGFPNPRSFEEEKGRVITLDGGKSIDFHLRLEGISDPGRVAQLAQNIDSRGTPSQLSKFDESWCTPR